MMSIPYFAGMGFPYSIEVFAYALGLVLGILLICSIAKLVSKIFKADMNFQNWFNVVGTLSFISALINEVLIA